jgi:hypothetical protein
MTRLLRPTGAFAVALVALVAASCSSDDSGAKGLGPGAALTTTTSTTTTPTTSTTTTPAEEMTTVTTYPPDFASPLNGLPATDSLLLDRRAIAVKIDNHPNARPQSGIDQADAMIETIVEGGITRFIALFHDDDADYIGPIRSLRPTDSAVVAPIEAPIAISGGQAWIQQLAAQRGVRLIGETQGYFRVGARPAPHNLYSDTNAIRRTADGRGWPDDRPPGLFEIGEWWIPDERATEIRLDWSSGNIIRWVWEEEDGVYTRWMGQTPHTWVHRDQTVGQVSADVLIVIAGTQHLVSPPGGDGSTVPGIETRGSGRAWVFALGRVWEGTWSREGYRDPFRLFELDGSPAVVPPGIPWISFFPSDRAVTYE